MMQQKFKLIAANIFILLLSHTLEAQERPLNEGEELYGDNAYIDAIAVFEQMAESGQVSPELYRKQGNSFYFNANYIEAEKWYRLFFESDTLPDPLYYLRYSQSLKANGNREEGEQYFKVFLDKTSASKEEIAIDFKELIVENADRYLIENMPFNSATRDFGGSVHGEELYFASTRDTGVIRRTINSWDGLGMLDIYTTSGTDETVQKLKGKINTKGHESTPVFTKDGKTMYFTRNAIQGKGKRLSNSNEVLKIYKAQLVNGQWEKEEELSINSDDFSTAHPALNASETYLYFASDRPGGMGQSDLYAVEIKEDGTFGQPRNLGPEINTIGRETFPSLQGDSILYFASDGHYGLGGLDIFQMDLRNPTVYRPVNIGSPVNSLADDYAYYVHTPTTGYFSSNRATGKGLDDIYSFRETDSLVNVFQQYLFGKVTDEETQLPVANAVVKILNFDQEILATVNTDGTGDYRVSVPRFVPQLVRTTSRGYYAEESLTDPEEKEQEINFELERNIFELYKGADLAKALGIENIYFGFDKSNIRSDAAKELEKVVAAMNEYPNIRIEVRSHTDARASHNYNLRLSHERAESTVAYLIDKGISPERLSSKGFGETAPINTCTDAVTCSEEDHQANRRSEFIVVDF